jgi:hypothetical protein
MFGAISGRVAYIRSELVQGFLAGLLLGWLLGLGINYHNLSPGRRAVGSILWLAPLAALCHSVGLPIIHL